MKKVVLVLLCCNALLFACDGSRDTASDASSDASEPATQGSGSVKEAASDAMDADKEVASEVMVEGEALKDKAIESAAAIDTAAQEISTQQAESDVVIASAGTNDAKQGESIYKTKCIACHGTGAAGAPKLDDKAAWEARIAQGDEVLIQHAIAGFKGETGYMPAKGGFMSLSDNDVSLAVRYMVSQAK